MSGNVNPAEAPATLAAFAFVKITVNDLPGAIAFFEQGFGLVVTMNLDFETFAEVVLRTAGVDGGPAIVLYHDKRGGPFTLGGGWGPLGFSVSDVDVVYANALRLGAKAVKSPCDVAGLRVAFVTGPEGHLIEILAPQGLAAVRSEPETQAALTGTPTEH